MRTTIVSLIEKIRGSYWFIPSLMAMTSAGLALFMTALDGRIAPEWVKSAGWLTLSQPEGARSLLSTVAGSMITVAGVTFSMTIVAISHASAQMGPRLMSNFMRDRGNQVTLGAFISTFLYCLLVLRTVRGSNGSGADALSAFVPQLAVAVALLLAILCVGVLIYFIHHVPESISMSSLIERVSGTLEERIRALYPTEIGDPAEDGFGSDDSPLPGDFAERSAVVRFEGHAGYLQYIDDQTMLATAREEDVIVSVEPSAGAYLSRGCVLARVYPKTEPLDADLSSRIRAFFVCGAERTARQDVLFPALELVEIAIRALSPGVNDPFTAERCLDRLGSAMVEMAHREVPTPTRLGDDGEVRLQLPGVDGELFADRILDAVRPHVQRDLLVCEHLLAILASVSSRVPVPFAEILERHREALYNAAGETDLGERDRETLLRAYKGTH